MNNRTRFEIFKRDKFVCQYCGKTPPEAVLQVDHIHPVSKGGTDEPENLITSCFECNRGKSNVLLGDAMISLPEKMAAEKEKFEQLKAYQNFLVEKANLTEQWVRRISDKWITLDGYDCRKWRIADKLETAIRRFLKLLPCEEIIDAVEVTYAKLEQRSYRDRFKFFCGVCWKKVRDSEAGIDSKPKPPVNRGTSSN